MKAHFIKRHLMIMPILTARPVLPGVLIKLPVSLATRVSSRLISVLIAKPYLIAKSYLTSFTCLVDASAPVLGDEGDGCRI